MIEEYPFSCNKFYPKENKDHPLLVSSTLVNNLSCFAKIIFCRTTFAPIHARSFSTASSSYYKNYLRFFLLKASRPYFSKPSSKMLTAAFHSRTTTNGRHSTTNMGAK